MGSGVGEGAGMGGRGAAADGELRGCDGEEAERGFGAGVSGGPPEGRESRRGFFVELWDVAGGEQYKLARSIFYREINGKGTRGRRITGNANASASASASASARL